ncbi:MAG: hypothetical protein ACR2P4_10215 [Gammaproteobacteria bacterium]
MSPKVCLSSYPLNYNAKAALVKKEKAGAAIDIAAPRLLLPC